MLQVVFVSIDKHHRVCVLLDRAGFAEVRELGALVLAVLNLAGELRQRQDGQCQFLGQRLEALGDHADLQHPAFGLGAGGRAHQLQVIDHDQRQALGAFQPPATGAQRRHGDRRGVVDLDRQRGDLAGDLDELVKILLADIAAADAVAGDAGLFGQQAGGELFGAHFQREDGDGLLGDTVGVLDAGFVLQRLGGAERDLGGERGLAHAGAAGEDQQVGRMHAAHLAVEVAQAGGQAGDAAGAAEGAFGAEDGVGQGAFEGDEAAAAAAVGGEVEQGLFGDLDLLRAIEFGVGAEGVVDHDLADVDELAAQPGVVDGAAVFAGVDDADHGGSELGQVGGAADLIEDAGVFEFGFQGDRVGKLAGFDAARNGLVDAAVDRVGEMFGGEEFGDALIGLVVGQEGAEQGLLRLDVGGRQALGKAEKRRVDGIHEGMLAHAGYQRMGVGLWLAVDSGGK